MVGSVSSYCPGFIAPSSAFDTSLNLLIPLLAMFGGIGTQLGPALGAFVLIPLQQNLTLQFGEQNWDLILFGAVFLLIVLLMPEGVLPALRRKAPLWLETASAWFTQFSRYSRYFWLPGYSAMAVSISTPEPIGEEDEEDWEDEGEVTAKKPVSLTAQASLAQADPSTALAPMTPRALQPTQRMKAIRLVGMHSETIREMSPVVVITPSPILSPTLAHRSSRMTGGACPRCGSPLRVLESMVFCRKCGLIVSKNI